VTNNPMSMSAAVLAGGQSRRMGQNKALLPIVDGGPPMLAIVLNRLRQVSDDLTIVANDAQPYEGFGLRIVPDLLPGSGALGGIQAALAAADHEHCLVVACDMPFLNVELLQRMASEPRDFDVLVPLLAGQSKQGKGGLVYQTLHAIYGKACAPAIEARIRQGDRRVIGFFDDVRVRTIAEDEVRKIDPGLRSFFNANTPEALAEARAMMASREQARSEYRSSPETDS
jgi:molybdopterin-guanine dinucleotide biosynthesis protein A